MKTQTSGDDAVNDLPYEIKFENCLKEKINFCIKQNIAFPSRRHIFFKISNNLITSAFFLPRQILKNIDMPWQKPQMLRW